MIPAPFRSRVYRRIRPLVGLNQIEFRATILQQQPPALFTSQCIDTLLQVVQHCPYYQPFLREHPAISNFPILTKSLIRQNFATLQNTQSTGYRYRNSSGGSTGRPITIIQDRTYASWSEATLDYYFQTFQGIDYLAVPKVVLWGSERDTLKERDLIGKVYNYLSNTLFLNTFNVRDAQWGEYLDTLTQVKPYFIKGYAGSLYELARAARRLGKSPYQPHFLYSSAEMLRDFMRKEIEEVFQAKVYDFYGSREVGPIAAECHKGRLHLFTFNTYLEVEPDGRFLVTTLHNHSMPLIRYEIGDTGKLGQGTCRCGSPLPWLAEISGRITDHFRTQSGNLVHGEFFTHLFYGQGWAQEFQVNQTELDTVEILIVPATALPAEDLKSIEHKIRRVMGDGCEITWKEVAAIPKTAQGKHLFTRCLLEEATPTPGKAAASGEEDLRSHGAARHTSG
jgi:phenylacetate-CoA ligase